MTLTYSITGPSLGNHHLIIILKCKHLHLGPPHRFEPCHINSLVIDSVTFHKDLGIQFDDQLKFHEHTSEVCTKANRILEVFGHLDIHVHNGVKAIYNFNQTNS